MRLNVNKLLHTPEARQDFRFELDLSDLEFGGATPVTEPVYVEGRVQNKAGVLLCDLSAHTTLHSICDRCTEEFLEEKTVDYSCILAEERQFDEDEDIVLLENDEVDLGDLARTAFILGMDTKTLCSPDCMGLCAGCGVNLNYETCRCKKQVDPRLAALAKLLENNE
ncbi:MAG: DUF177 domain-containing protein [Clostridiales bacterium]|nr:DUF177 domain-containing protein [Candidatus Cacconaster stercorequi]